MKPLDPRLLRRAAPARRYLAIVIGSGVLTAALVVAQATILAHIIVNARSGSAELRSWILALLVVVVGRGLLGYLGELSALRAAAAVRSSLRRDLAGKVADLGPAWSDRARSGSVATLMTKGLDALDGYFARYLPQLVLATLVPVVVMVRIAASDPTSAVVVAVTVPLIPVFMILIGMHTKARTDRQWNLLSRLGGHFLDVVEGLPTLKVFGRAKAQVDRIRAVSNDYRRTTMATLRIAFLSALALELLATLATAVVAVEVGLRLLNGRLGYETALLVLLLTPEAYLPLRAVGASFHASADGVAAVTDALEVLELEPASASGMGLCDLNRSPILLTDVVVRYPDRDEPALGGVSLRIEPGDYVAISGESGAGKSSLLAVLLGFVSPEAGRIDVGNKALSDLDLTALRSQIAWVPQTPRIFAGTFADNIRLDRADASDADVAAAASEAGIAEFIESLPAGYETVVGERGMTLSTGQRQRLALARVFARDARLVLLDEPGAHLDEVTADAIRTAVDRLAVRRTVVVISHDPAWLARADKVVELSAGLVLRSDERVPRETLVVA